MPLDRHRPEAPTSLTLRPAWSGGAYRGTRDWSGGIVASSAAPRSPISRNAICADNDYCTKSLRFFAIWPSAREQRGTRLTAWASARGDQGRQQLLLHPVTRLGSVQTGTHAAAILETDRERCNAWLICLSLGAMARSNRRAAAIPSQATANGYGSRHQKGRGLEARLLAKPTSQIRQGLHVRQPRGFAWSTTKIRWRLWQPERLPFSVPWSNPFARNPACRAAREPAFAKRSFVARHLIRQRNNVGCCTLFPKKGRR